MYVDYVTYNFTQLRISSSRVRGDSFFLDFVYLFYRERGREGEREEEKHQCVVASCTPPTGDPAHNLGMCPDWESTGNFLFRRPVLNSLSHTSQGLGGSLGLSVYRSRHMTIEVTLCLPFPLVSFSFFFAWLNQLDPPGEEGGGTCGPPLPCR